MPDCQNFERRYSAGSHEHLDSELAIGRVLAPGGGQAAAAARRWALTYVEHLGVAQGEGAQ